MASPIATAYVEVRGDFSRFGPDVIAQTQQVGQSAGQQLTEKFRNAGQQSGSSFISGLKSGIGGLSAISGAFTAVFGALAAGGLHAEESQKRLVGAIEGSGRSYDVYKGRINEAIQEGQRFGHTTSETENALTQLSARFQDPIEALRVLNLAFILAAAQGISFASALTRATGVAAGLPRVLKQYAITLVTAQKAQATLKTATEAHVGTQTRLQNATQKLSDLQAILNERHGAGSSSTGALASAEKNLAKAREDHANTSAKNLAQAEQNLIDLQARLAESTKITTSDTRRLRDAHDDLNKAIRSRDREAFIEASKRVGDAEQDIAEKSKLSVSEQQNLRDAEQAIVDARTEQASKGDQVIAAEEAIANARSESSAAATDSLSSQFQLRDAQKELADAQAADAIAAAALAEAQRVNAGAAGAAAKVVDDLAKSKLPAANAIAGGLLGTFRKIVAQIKSARDEAAKFAAPVLTIASGSLGFLSAGAGIAQVLIGLKSLRAASAAAKIGLVEEALGAGIAAAATEGLGAAIALSLLPYILAIGAAVLVAVVVFKNFDKIKEIVGNVVGFVKNKIIEFGDVFLVLSGPVGWLVLFFIDHFETIKKVIGGALKWIGDKVGDLVGIFTGLGKRLGDAAGDVFGFLKDSLKRVLHDIVVLWNKLDFKVPKIHIPGTNNDFGGFDLFPDFPVPALARGGMTNGPLLALLGDNPSGKERVTPLDSWGRGPGEGSGVVFGPGSVVVSFAGVVPSEAQAMQTGQAVGRGIVLEMERADARRTRRIS